MGTSPIAPRWKEESEFFFHLGDWYQKNSADFKPYVLIQNRQKFCRLTDIFLPSVDTGSILGASWCGS